MPHTLPMTSNAIVVQWQTQGGLTLALDRMADLTIYADGKTVVGSRFGQGSPVERQLPMAQLQDLLKFALDEKHFFEFDSKAVEANIQAILQQRQRPAQSGEARAIPLGPPYIDAGTTVIMFAADGYQHEVSFHGLAFAAQDFPEIEALQNLRAIELRLLEVAETLTKAN